MIQQKLVPIVLLSIITMIQQKLVPIVLLVPLGSTTMIQQNNNDSSEHTYIHSYIHTYMYINARNKAEQCEVGQHAVSPSLSHLSIGG